jgi:hypothetical protein
MTPDQVSLILERREVRAYVDAVFLDSGYRNRAKLFDLLDEVIASKLEEARESEMYSSKDLADLIALAHKMRQDELKVSNPSIGGPKVQTNVQINETPFGSGNYGNLIKQLLCNPTSNESSSVPPS